MALSFDFRTNVKMRCQSAPLQRRRTLDEYPMDFTKGEAQSLANYWRHQRFLKSDFISRISVESGNQCQYGRTRFDYVVKKAVSDSPSNKKISCDFLPIVDSPSNKKISCDFLPIVDCNGPSTNGSPLYNKTPALLNSIRLRPKSHYGGTDRTASHPDIKKTLTQSNCNYKVAFARPQSEKMRNPTPCQSVTSEYILIPKNFSDKSLSRSLSCHSTESEESEKIPDISLRAETPDLRASPAMLISPTKYPAPSSSSSPSSLSSACSSLSRVPPDPMEATESKEIEDSEMKQELSQDKSDGHPTKANLEENTQNLPTTENSQLDSTTAATKKTKKQPKPTKLKSKNNRPRCWVDDVTVSSDPSVHSEEPEIEPEDALDKVDGVQEKQDGADGVPPVGSSNSKQALTVEFADPLVYVEANEVHPVLPEPVKEELNVVNLDDLKERKLELPKFICPSSETKSRQTAIKDWLASTTFTYASRQKPLF